MKQCCVCRREACAALHAGVVAVVAMTEPTKGAEQLCVLSCFSAFSRCWFVVIAILFSALDGLC